MGAAPLHAFAYTVDAVLNIDTISETIDGTLQSPLYDYDYDGVSRLTSAAYPTGLGLPTSEAFPYDAAGNRDDDPGSATPWAYDANNRIEASPTPGGGADTTYAFDADGNVQTRTTPSGTQTLTFDATNRLRTWTDGTATASYTYDPFGRRIRKTANGTTTWYLWDGDRLLAEYDGSGTRTARYAYAGGFAPVQYAAPDGVSGEDVYDVHSDHLDTPKLLTDASGSPVWRAVHEAFGRAAIEPANTISFSVRFPGQYFDEETELHYNRFRTYDSMIGRYVEADPIGQAGGMNLYAYAITNPLRFTDRLGLELDGSWGEAPPYFPSATEHANRNAQNRCPRTRPDPESQCSEWRQDEGLTGLLTGGKLRHPLGYECAYDSNGSLLRDEDGNYTFNFGAEPWTPQHFWQDLFPHFRYGGPSAYTRGLTDVF